MTMDSWPAPTPGTPSSPHPAHLDVDIAILGAGIHGAALARELTLRNVTCALVDRGALGGGTSQWSSKLLHGGIRYLLTGDIRQILQGLQERATWVRIAPHRCRWEAFWMPHRGLCEGLAHRMAIGLYDSIGSKRPQWPPELHLGSVPPSDFWSDPRSHQSPFRGATAYADLLTWDGPLVRDLAASSAAILLDFHELSTWTVHQGQLQEAHLTDLRNGTQRHLKARQWVCTLGPWTDAALEQWFHESSRRLRLSAGLHIWFEPVPGCTHPWAVRRAGGRILFLIPRDGMLQVGTTEREVHTGWTPPVDAERNELFSALEANHPSIPWRQLTIHHEELGVRPLLTAPGSTSGLSREARLEPHPRFPNLHLVLGGKLTTARLLMSRLATHLTGSPCPASNHTPLTKWDRQIPQSS